MSKTKRVYLDWAAATPLLPEAAVAMEPWLKTEFANPSAIHQEGQTARDAVEAARTQIARSVQVRPEFVTFTGSGTEANNIAILGTIERLRQAGQMYAEMEVVSTAIEHPSVSNTLRYLASLGVTHTIAPVKESGVIDLQALRALLSPKTVLVSTHYVNSEIGTIQPTRAIKKVLEDVAPTALLHIDGAQAPLWLSCQFDSVGADMLTLDAGKCCGPKGVGLLITAKHVELTPPLFGGGQEGGLRPGTENVAGIVGAATAFAWAQAGWRERAEQVRAVRNQAITQLTATIPEVLQNGADPDSDERVSNNINISIPHLDTEFTTVVLDTNGFAVSTKSACSGAGGGESVVVQAISDDSVRAASTLRITLGPDNTAAELEQLATVLKGHIEKMAI